MPKDLDIYKITIDEIYSDGKTDLGIEQIAFVKSPAIQVKGMAFNSQTKNLTFKDDVKMRIAAPALIPMQIYRYDQEYDYEYYVEFTPQVIEQLYSKFMKDLSNRDKFNLEHDPSKTVPAYVLESILVDSEPKIKMIKDEYSIDIPLGSVFIVSQITDKDYYNSLVKEERFAYSIEGFLGLEYIETKLSEIKNKNKEMKNTILSKIERENFTQIKEISKWTIDVDNSSFAVGDLITYTYEDETRPICDGEYELEDGRKILVDSEGVIRLIIEKEELSDDNNKNKNKKIEMEENLMLPDGEHTIGEKIYVVKDGKVVEIKDVVKEEMGEDTPAAEDKKEEEEVVAAEVPAETPAPEAEVTPTIDEATVMSILQPKLDEIYAMIADLKAQIAGKEDVQEEITEDKIEMSVNQKFSTVMNFLKED